ncbi:glycosyltransferase [Halobacillus sp. GSS1]|uniref:glycosyltransferase n=1 Tax=Halobacillus sp. GSS1 TaxID=2815919 RepID=UPI001A8F4440|nr:glycosyltransferase [Halobacillus sp. GSS1]MBN9655052.1 glycosyltransferase [Halobacillus sp. GSS1]
MKKGACKGLSIVFLVPYVPIPRMVKRINTANSVENTSVIFWDRGTDKTSNLSMPTGVKKHQIIENANEGEPLKRVGATLRFCKKAFSLLKKEAPSCIHVTKTDMLLLVWLYSLTKKKRPYIIYEVSDIHSLALNKSKSISGNLMKMFIYLLERIGMSIVDRLIVTSESFWKVYYQKMISKDSTVFLPNAPEEASFNGYKAKDKGRFCIGFIGKVRYKKQLKMLIDAADRADVDVLIAGNGIDLNEIKNYSAGMENVTIHGAYNYNKEIAQLYSNIDCVFSVYDTNIQNVRIALPNRLYEATLCELPLIVSKNTELADIVEDNGLGIAIKDDSIDELTEALLSLRDNSYMATIKRNCKAFYNKNKYEATNERLYNIYKYKD